MLKRLLLTTTILTLAAAPIGIAPALAQDSNQSGQPAANAPAPAAGQAPISGQPAVQPQAAAPVTPPPSDAIIAAEGNNEFRADTLIGMKVYNADGQEVGKVKDVVFDKDGKAKGVVLSVGGVLGIGAKSVGLQWKEIDLQPEKNVVKVNYSKEQLEAAPSFLTHESQQSSEQPSPALSPGGSEPSPSTTPSTGSGSTQ